VAGSTTGVREYDEPGSPLRAVLQAAPAAIALTRGAEHVMGYANAAYGAIFGEFPTGKPAREALPEWPEALFAAMDDVLGTGESYRTAEMPVTMRWAGEHEPRERFFDVSYSAVPTGDGRGTWGVCTVAVEVTELVTARRAAQRRLEIRDVLRQAKAAVDASLDPAADLQALAEAAVPGLADVATVHRLVEPVPVGAGRAVPVTTERVAVSAIGKLGQMPSTGTRVSWDGGEDPVATVIGSGQPLAVNTPPDACPAWSARTGSVAAIRSGVHHVGFVPVIVDGDVVAIACFGAFTHRSAFDADELDALAEVGRHAGTALAKALTYQRARETSLVLQHSLLSTMPAVPGLEVCGRYRPAGAEEVGGDFYDLFPHSPSRAGASEVSAVIGDVVGHSIDAAAAMGRLRSSLQALSLDGDGAAAPAALLDRLAAVNRHAEITAFATLAYIRLRRDDDGAWRGRWARAGHLPPILLAPDGSATVLAVPAGAALVTAALPEKAPREEHEITLVPGATLLCYTDGLLERPGVGLDAAIAELAEHAEAAAKQPIERMCQELMRGAPERDDAALLAMRVPTCR
jgi:serine phosphatase RsbU (regulator of sigma subunit)